MSNAETENIDSTERLRRLRKTANFLLVRGKLSFVERYIRAHVEKFPDDAVAAEEMQQEFVRKAMELKLCG